MTVILDMDGVLVDFCTPAYRAHGRTCATNEPQTYDFFEGWGMTADEFWEPIDALGPDWWANLEPYPWAEELLSLAAWNSLDDGIVIATTPSRSPHSTAGKIVAIQRLLGKGFRNYFITPRKWLLGAPGRVLIDDNEDNCAKFGVHGGRPLLFPQPWNTSEHVGNRMEFVKAVMEEYGYAVL